MSGPAHTWRLPRYGPVRADAEGLFIPLNELPGAQVGDRIVVHGGDQNGERTGVVVELVDDADIPSLRLALDPQR